MKEFLEKIYFLLVFGELTTAIPRVMGPGNSDPALVRESNPVLLFFNLLVIGGTFYFAFPQLPLLWRALIKLRWTFLLYLWAALSILWSVDGPTTARIGLYCLIYLFSAAYFAFRYDTEQLLKLLGGCFLGVAILTVPGQFLLPPTDDPAPGWSGIFLQKNVLGLCMMLGIAVLLVQGKRWTLYRAGRLIFYLVLLGLSQSFTAIVSVAAITLFMFSKRLSGWGRAILWTSLVGLACAAMIVSDPVDLILNAGGRSSNLTGRDVIWAFALRASVEKPFLGHGYGGAYWAQSYDTAVQTLHWNPHHAHNGYLEILLDLGIVGLILIIGFLINSWRRARRLQHFDQTLTPLWTEVLILAAVAHNLTESDFMSNNIFWYLLMLGSFACFRVEEAAPDAAETSETLPAEKAEMLSV